MPIYEYYCPDNHRIYQFYAKTLAQGRQIPKCPDNPKFRMEKVVSAFAVTGRAKEASGAGSADAGADDPRVDSAMAAMEREFSHVDENDPKAMGRMMRRMAELSGEKIDGQMEEVVRRLEEGADPESLEDQLGEEDAPAGGEENAAPSAEKAGARRHRGPARGPAFRDPRLHDYE